MKKVTSEPQAGQAGGPNLPVPSSLLTAVPRACPRCGLVASTPACPTHTPDVESTEIALPVPGY